MNFFSLEFVFLFLLLLTILKLLDNNEFRKVLLLIFSYYFYAYWDYRFLSLIFASTTVDYFIARALSRSNTKFLLNTLLLSSLSFNLGILFFFKYFNFFIDSIRPVLSIWGVNPGSMDIILPVGISFYTFQTLSYTIDVYRKKISVCMKFLDFALYVGFFPQLVAGPIVRASHFLPQLKTKRLITFESILDGGGMFIRGLFKKILLADHLAMFVDPVFEGVSLYSSLTIWCAALGYALQIYFDFSGYSDMAIGIARSLGYELNRNFNFPYLATSASDFWKRWHISLSSWIRDYVYIPLGGRRKGQKRLFINLMISMLLCGLWHGASWTFILWGGLHGCGLILQNFFPILTKKNAYGKEGGFAGWLITFFIVLMGWVLFRASSVPHAMQIFKHMYYPSPGVIWMDPFFLSIFSGTILLHLCHLFQIPKKIQEKTSQWPMFEYGFHFSLLWGVVLFYPQTFTPFIYFQF